MTERNQRDWDDDRSQIFDDWIRGNPPDDARGPERGEEAGSEPFAARTPIATGSGSPFFCVHPHGGAVGFFLPLARRLQDEFSFIAFKAAGLGAAQGPATTVEEMAETYVGEILASPPEDELLVGGFSLGGFVALEIARRLRDRGKTPDELVLLDPGILAPGTWPGREENDGLLHRRSLVTTRMIDRLQEEVDEIRDPDDGSDRGAPAASGVIPILQQAPVPLPREDILSMDRDELASYADVIDAHHKAQKSFEPQVYEGPATVIFSEETLAGRPEAPDAFAEIVGGRYEVERVPGGHFSMLDEPHVEHLSAQLVETLTRATERDEGGG